VTRYAPLWQQNGTYPAQTDRALLAALFPQSGVSGMQVSIVAGTMNVNVQPGAAAVALSGGNFTAFCRSDGVEQPPALATPPGAGQSRIDLVVLQVRDAVIDAGTNNDFIFAVTTGVPAASNPQVPAVQANQVALAQLLIPGGGTNLNGATLTDLRQPMNPLQQLHSRVYRSSNFGIGTAATVIAFDTVERDAFGLYSLAQQRWNIKIAGWYEFHGLVTLIPNTSGQWIQGALYKNGASYAQGTQGTFTGGSWPQVQLSTAMFLNPVDYLDVRCSVSVNLNGQGGQAFTFGDLHYMGTG
jgi:hypothetical protein